MNPNPKEIDMTHKTDTTVAQYLGVFQRPAYAHKHLPFVTEADVPNTVLMRALYRCLRSMRPHESMAEARLTAWLANCLPITMIDGAGNLHVDLRTQPYHRTMFTSHTDSVHHKGGTNNIRLDASDPERLLWRADEGDCLGADDGAGVALMVHMIDRRVPGLYVFFRGEEVGGLGSGWLADNGRRMLSGIERCVSLDRAGTSDVVTHQAGGRCCSDVFAEALAAALMPDDMSLAFLPDSTGVFTDSANFTEVIPECTNLSVGYKHQHGDGEYQDITFLQRLAEQLCVVGWDDLPTVRDPSPPKPTTPPKGSRWATSTTATPTKGTGVPPAPDADTQFLVDCLYDAAWGKHRPLQVAVSMYCGVDETDIDTTQLHPSSYEDYAELLMTGSETTDNAYLELGELLYVNN